MAPRAKSWMTSPLLAVASLCLVTITVMMMTYHGLGLPPRAAAAAVAAIPRHKRAATASDYQIGKDDDTEGGDTSSADSDPPLPAHSNSESGGGGDLLRYGVLLDAGSSSTKVKVYAYTSMRSPAQVGSVPHVRPEMNKRMRPGLSSFVGAADGRLRNYMADVLGYATNVVPKHLHPLTPVYLMATAGMRVLTANETMVLLERVEAILSNTSLNPFLFHKQHVNVLAGEEEAAYAWVALNYLRGHFSNKTQGKSVGVLEMGGGSMQVAFRPDQPLYQEEFQIYLAFTRYDLYAQTYLSYGSNFLTKKLRSLLLEQQQKKLGRVPGMKVYSPCTLAGDNDTIEWENQTYEVVGTGNASQCEAALASLLPSVDPIFCSPRPCTIRDTYQPAVGDHPFYATSAFLYAPKTLGALEEGGVLNITKLRRKATEYCHLTLNQAVAQTGTKAAFASNDCLMGLYIPLLLTTALGFNQNTRTITVAKQINGTDIDWALGAMVQLLSMTFLADPDHMGPCHPTNQHPNTRSSSSSGSHLVEFTFTLMFVAPLFGVCMHLLWL